MPEGPEIHVAGRLVNRVSDGRIYSGKVLKSAVSTKNPDVPWDEPGYTISATTRGKEIRLILTKSEDDSAKGRKKKQTLPKNGGDKKQVHILFRFGMSGKFVFKPKSEMDKHNHLNFFSRDDDMVLSFNDYRRFGRWEITEEWGNDRGPCIILEYELFRQVPYPHFIGYLDVFVVIKSINTFVYLQHGELIVPSNSEIVT